VAIRVVLADDHHLVREGVRRLLGRAEPGSPLSAVNLDSLLDAVDAERPDVVVTDIGPPGPTRHQAAERLRQTHPGSGRRPQPTRPGYALAP
jgi:DNA-binding NarL/FixJ family response regulator